MSALWRAITALPYVARFAAELESTPAGANARHDRAVRAIVGRAAAMPFYRRQWGRVVKPDQGASAAALLADLPVIDCDAWRSSPAEDVEGDPEKVIRLATGGSTGAPLLMPYRPIDFRRLRAGIQAIMRVHGARLTGRMLRFLPPDVPLAGGSELLGRVRHVSSNATTQERSAALAGGSWGMLRSYPWPAWRAAVNVHLRSGVLPSIPLMFAGGEVLTGTIRRTLQRLLGGRVVDRYAATDWGLIAAECRLGRLHVMSSFVHVEVLQGDSPAPPGTLGDVVVTNLLSTARPIVRVRTGDRAARGVSTCACGNRAPCLEWVAGREDEILVLPGGRLVPWPAIESAFPLHAPEVLGWQAAQISPREVLVRVALQDGARVPAGLAETLRECLPGVRVEVVADGSIPAAPNGKTRVVVGADVTRS